MALPVNGSTHLIPAYYSFYRPRKDDRLSWPSWLTYSGWLTHISGHPSAAGRAQDRESSPARDRRSTTLPRHQLQRQLRWRSTNSQCSKEAVFIAFDPRDAVLQRGISCDATRKTPHRAPPCEELDPPYDIKLVFVQQITFVPRKINKKLLPPELHFLTPIFTKSFVGWASP